MHVDFVHSGGWKKLEAIRVDRATLDQALLGACAPGSRVVDFYGLVEQNGILFPLCAAGFRHAPLWSEVIVRDPFSMLPLGDGQEGLLQLLNPLPRGAPSHSVLTEDVGRRVAGECLCGWKGRRFELIGDEKPVARVVVREKDRYAAKAHAAVPGGRRTRHRNRYWLAILNLFTNCEGRYCSIQ